MGIFSDGADHQTINSVDVSPAGDLCVTDDEQRVKLFNFPCVVEDAPCRAQMGHSSHVLAARFLGNPDPATTSFVVSAGGDKTWSSGG